MIGRDIAQYRITARIGSGGMGDVYKAVDTRLERVVTLKFLAPERLLDEAARKRFLREAQAAANLSHPNIVNVYDWGKYEGTYFIVMEYVDVRDLRSCMDWARLKQRPLPVLVGRSSMRSGRPVSAVVSSTRTDTAMTAPLSIS